ncbi:MAG TPA: metallophosphoesterase N-terminal domain-containing protein, partial [bacterium]|nr:metallophosphoesterase N-terminal domain-containing protein [bacterium]
MKRILFVLCFGVLMTGFLLGTSASAQEGIARGIVFNDQNNNGVRDAHEKGLRGVGVSNGTVVVQTDGEGKYELPVQGEETCLFVIKPTNWTPPLNDSNLMRFHYFHKPKGSQGLKVAGLPPSGDLPDSVDFPLIRRIEPTRFKVLMLGDPQTTNSTEVSYYARDVLAELVGTDAAFGVTLGDIVNDRPLMFEDNVAAVATVGVPWHHVIGNHDRNYDAQDYDSYDDTYNRVVGPSHYSFNWGGVHFIVLNNVHSLGKYDYEGKLTQAQLDFVKHDLAVVPDKQLIVLMMHIPLNETRNREEIFRLIEKRPYTFSISAHNHNTKHRFFEQAQGWQGTKPHHHFVSPTSCGSWWMGVPDEVGIPHAM